jgi:Mg2+ and Co2+ transporter CorA
VKGELTMKQLADCLEAVNEQIYRMEQEHPRDHEALESIRDTRKRVKYLLRQAVAQSNLEA